MTDGVSIVCLGKLDMLPMILLTLYKRIGYVKIPKPHFQAVVAVLTCCFSPFLLNLSPLWSLLSLAINRPWPALLAFSTGRSLVHSTDTCARLGVRISFWVFFAYIYIKQLLGRPETRTRDRIDCQSIWTVWDISREPIEQDLRPAVC